MSVPALRSQRAPSMASSVQLDRILLKVLTLKTTFGTKGKGEKGPVATNLQAMQMQGRRHRGQWGAEPHLAR